MLGLVNCVTKKVLATIIWSSHMHATWIIYMVHLTGEYWQFVSPSTDVQATRYINKLVFDGHMFHFPASYVFVAVTFSLCNSLRNVAMVLCCNTVRLYKTAVPLDLYSRILILQVFCYHYFHFSRVWGSQESTQNLLGDRNLLHIFASYSSCKPHNASCSCC